MLIAITGATGFLGQYVVRSFLDGGHANLIVIARREENAHEVFNNKVRIFESDYCLESLVYAFSGVDVIIHLAAKTMSRETNNLKISEFYKANILLTENVLLAAHHNNVRRVCQMSSNSVYSGANKLPFVETDIPVPSNIYGVSKLFGEQLGEYFMHKTGLQVVSLRLARLFGYGERPGVVFSKYMNLAIKKEPLEIWGEGKTSIEYIYVKDAVEAIHRAIDKDVPGGVYNVGTGKAYTVREIADKINSICGNQNNIVFDKTKEEGNYRILMDNSKFFTTTNWTPGWDLSGAIEDMLNSMKNE